MATQSLFGGSLTPQEMQAQMLEQKAAQFAQMSPDQQLGMMAYKAGSGVGTGLAGAFGVQTQDPMIQRATKLRALASQYNTNTAAGLRQMADALRTQDPEMALQLSQKAAAMDLEAAKLDSEKAQTEQRKAAATREKTPTTPADIAKAQRIAALQEAIPAYEKVGDTTTVNLLKNELKALQPADKAPSFGAEAERYARQFFNKGYDQLTSAEMVKVNAKVEETAKDRATKIVLPGVKTAGDVTGLRKDLQAITKPYQDQADAAGDAIDLANMAIKSNNFAAVSSLSRSLAKAAGETQLSGKDVEAFGIDPSLVGSVADTVSKLAKSRPTVDTLTKLRQLAEALKKKAESRISVEEQQLQETARVSGQFTEPQINTVFRRRPALPANNQKTTRSGVTYTVEKD